MKRLETTGSDARGKKSTELPYQERGQDRVCDIETCSTWTMRACTLGGRALEILKESEGEGEGANLRCAAERIWSLSTEAKAGSRKGCNRRRVAGSARYSREVGIGESGNWGGDTRSFTGSCPYSTSYPQGSQLASACEVVTVALAIQRTRRPPQRFHQTQQACAPAAYSAAPCSHH